MNFDFSYIVFTFEILQYLLEVFKFKIMALVIGKMAGLYHYLNDELGGM